MVLPFVLQNAYLAKFIVNELGCITKCVERICNFGKVIHGKEKPKKKKVEGGEMMRGQKKEKIVPVRFTFSQHERLLKDAKNNGYADNLSAYIRANLIGETIPLSLTHEIKACEFQINRIINNIRQLISSTFVTTEEKLLLQDSMEKILKEETLCLDSYKKFSVENQEQLIFLEKELQEQGYKIFEVLNDFLIGIVDVDKKEDVIIYIQDVPKILEKRRCP